MIDTANQTPMTRIHRLWEVPPRLLLAEDEDDLRELLADNFRAAGFHVVEAEDGTTMLDYLADAVRHRGQERGFDLIVSDIRMPGFTALQILKNARFVFQGTPIILMTAFGSRQAHQRAALLGASAVFDKPVDIDVLLEAARRLLEA